MKRLTCLALCSSLVTLAGCSSAPRASDPATAATDGISSPTPHWQAAGSGTDAARATPVARVTEIPLDKDATTMPGHPLTSVIVTQCNLIVAVYMTMPDGRLLRFDKATAIPSEQLMNMAQSASRSERVEVSCNDNGVEGYEKHEPV
jgi:hypothetical protein